MRFDPSVLAPDPRRRRVVLEVLEAAVAAVDPASAVEDHLRFDGGRIEIDGGLPAPRRVDVLAVGKAAAAMCRAASKVLGGAVGRMLVVSEHEEELPSGARFLRGEHPWPGPGSLAAGRAALEFARTVAPDDRLVVLVSGGGSALVEVPADGLTLDDLAATHRALMDRGVPIHELNTVRRHLSKVKNGGIARAHGRPLVTLLVSDVVDGPASDVASGPTLPDGSAPADALAVIRRSGADVPQAVVAHLQAASPPPPVDPGPWQVVADGARAATAAMQRAATLGLDARVATTSLRGEARVEGPRACREAPGGLTVLAGETTVHVTGGGRGGRNQEAALAAAMAIEGSDILFAAFGTDGIDGPTDAAGAIVDGGTVARAEGFDPAAALDDNDAYPFLRASGDLLVCGPTGTNVGDVWLVWKHSRP